MPEWLDWLKEKLGMETTPAKVAKPGSTRATPAKAPARAGNATKASSAGPRQAAEETDDQAFARLCKDGDKADSMLVPGKYANAVAAYQAIVDAQFARKKVDTYLMSKAALGTMLAHIQLDQLQEAHKVWLGSEDDRWQIGVESLDSGSVSVNDTILYMQVTAFFHSLSGGSDSEQATVAVNDICTRLCNYYSENQPALLPEMLNQWRLYLGEVYDNKVPASALQELNSYAASAKAKPTGSAKLKFLLKPDKWEINWG